MDELDLVSKTREFEESLDANSGKPKAVTLVLEQIRELENQFAKPLRSRLEALYSNITALDEKLTQLQVPVSSLLVKLQHAQALLAENMKDHFSRAAKEEFQQMITYIDQYIAHVKNQVTFESKTTYKLSNFQMESEVTSCEPLSQIARQTTAAVCSYTIDPYVSDKTESFKTKLHCRMEHGCVCSSVWYCWCRLWSFPILWSVCTPRCMLFPNSECEKEFAHSISSLSIVEPPSESHHMSSFITDTYDTRPKPWVLYIVIDSTECSVFRGYANYTYTDDYQRTYRWKCTLYSSCVTCLFAAITYFIKACIYVDNSFESSFSMSFSNLTSNSPHLIFPVPSRHFYSKAIYFLLTAQNTHSFISVPFFWD